MKILAIETSSKICAVALFQNDRLIKEKILEDENTHSIKLMPLVDDLLKETKTNLKDIDLFACDKGPGSFTGIRIGIATVKAFSDVTCNNVLGITSLEALAYNVERDGMICSLIDAKNKNVYCGFFEKSNGEVIQVGELKFNNIINVIDYANSLGKQIVFIGNASEVYKDIIKSKLRERATFAEKQENNKLNARNIALAAYYNRSQGGNSDSISPTYLRQSNAERQICNRGK